MVSKVTVSAGSCLAGVLGETGTGAPSQRLLSPRSLLPILSLATLRELLYLMAMDFSVLSTGSKANSTYIQTGESAILIDCGLSAKECKARMQKVGINPSKIKAILITHEHGDHIRGISVLSRQLQIPVYANKATAAHFENVFAVENFKTGESFKIGNFEIEPFSIVHDADDPVGFAINDSSRKFIQLTDLGRVTGLVRRAIENCDGIVLESNYDSEKLMQCDYSWELKQRISSAHGHLSNNDSAALLADILHPKLKHVILGHLSENSNSPELVIDTFSRFVDSKAFHTFVCGSVYDSTPLLAL